MKNRIWVLLIAAAVDLLTGDPPGFWHPVQGIGKHPVFRVPEYSYAFVGNHRNKMEKKCNSFPDTLR